MKRRTIILVLPFILVGLLYVPSSLAGQTKIHPYLQDVLTEADATSHIGINILLKDRLSVDYLLRATDGMDRKKRRAKVVQMLKQHANQTQASLRSFLVSAAAQGNASDASIIWMINVIHVKATPATIIALALSPDIEEICYDAEQPGTLLEDVTEPSGTGGDNPLVNNAGLALIRAQQAWALGYKGQGIVVGNIDSGVDYTHPDLRNHYFINDGEDLNHNGQYDPSDINNIDDDANGFIDDIRGWDFGANDNDATYQSSNHGVSTVGIVVGDGTNGDTTGVAPMAKNLALKAYSATGSSTESGIWQCMQYAVMMGADITTSSLSYKWAFSPKPMYHMWRAMSDVEYAAGLLHTNSIGNQGGSSSYPIPYNISTPGSSPAPWFHKDQIIRGRPSSTLGCGDVSATTDIIESSSGRGPAAWEDIQIVHPEYPYVQPEMYRDYPWETISPRGKGLTKPDVSAPGANTRSTAPGGGYSSFGGTSGATPHVAGTAALAWSANPTLTAENIAQILMTTGVEKGAPGKDSLYGAGRIDARNAVFAARHLVAGVVRDSVTNSPLGYARIHVPQLSYTFSTNANGEYIIFAKVDTVTLNVTAFAHSPRSATIIIPNGVTPVARDFVLPPSGTLTLSGTVKRLVDSTAVRGQIRAFVDSSSLINPVRSAAVDSMGDYSMNLYAGTYKLIVEPEAPYLTDTISAVTLSAPSTTLSFLVRTANVLIIDDDDGEGQQMFYKLALNANAKTHYTWDVKTLGLPPLSTFDKLTTPKIVFWATGNDDTTAITPSEFARMSSFVSGTGRRGLLLSGQNIAQFADTNQLAALAGVRYAGISSTETTVRGAAGDSVSNGMSMNTTGGNGAGNQTSRDVLVQSPGSTAVPFLLYGSASTNIAGVRRYVGNTRLAFLGFGLESVPNNQGTTTRTAFVNRIITWFTSDLPSGVETEQMVPQAIRLEQNYPNPFNPTTNIKYQIPSTSFVTLKIFDILGREVASLANGEKPAGSHVATWDGRNNTGMRLSSGIYFYRLEVKPDASATSSRTERSFIATKKLILLN